MAARRTPTPEVRIPMNAVGWGGPALLMALLVMLVGVVLLPGREWLVLLIAVLVGGVLAFVGYRRRDTAALVLDRHGVHVRWRDHRLDVAWHHVRGIRRSTVWFDADAVIGGSLEQIPARIRRSVLSGRMPSVRLNTFTRSLESGRPAEVIAAYRPDIRPGRPARHDDRGDSVAGEG